LISLPSVPATRHALLVSLTLCAFAILGYHPNAEDGGIYSAAVQQRLQPSLFPYSHEFVMAHVGHSAFAELLVIAARLTHLPTSLLFLAIQLLSLALLLHAAQRVANALYTDPAARQGAALLLALACSLPVAGTALYVVDPYCTARSLSTPLLLYALERVLTKRYLHAVLLLVGTAAFHPVMALWGALVLGCLLCLQQPKPVKAVAAFIVLTLVVFAVVFAFSPKENTLHQASADSRPYWFLLRWQWYEVVGAIAPIALIAAIVRFRPASQKHLQLAQVHAIATLLCLLLAFLFARQDSANMLIARIQPLRTLHLLYVVFLLLLGGAVGGLFGKKKPLAVALGLLVAGSLFYSQRTLYPASDHLELPWRYPANGWSQAFLWARDHTQQDALFALDAHYITHDGEDAQNFRSLSLRSSLPDYSKDGGVASVSPSLSEQWQLDLDTLSDADRQQRLLPLHVDWIVLPQSAMTRLVCEYENRQAKVCRLPPLNH